MGRYLFAVLSHNYSLDDITSMQPKEIKKKHKLRKSGSLMSLCEFPRSNADQRVCDIRNEAVSESLLNIWIR